MKTILQIALIAFCSTVAWCDKGPIGLANLYQIDKLPYVYTGVRVMQMASHDRTGGNNDRGNYTGSSGSEYNMLDVAGPGCVYRIWMTGIDTGNRIRIYLDGASSPQVNKTVAELLGGSSAPFLSPLVGDYNASSGGYYCYVPIPFRTGCKITIDNSNAYYHVTYQMFSDTEGVTTFTGSEDVSAVLAQWNNCGSDPKSTPVSRQRTGTVNVATGQTVGLIDEAGPASISHIKIYIPRLDTYDDTAKAIMMDTRIRIYWDNEPTPRVDSPIGPFFGSWRPGSNFKALLFGTITPARFHCYFPMPFASRARVQIYNGGTNPVSNLSYDIGIAEMPTAAAMLANQQIGRFSAVYKYEPCYYGGPDFIMGSKTGQGCAVGVSVLFSNHPENGNDAWYLEGDERIHYDGSLTPAIYGTGTEDFFNAGWYFANDIFYKPLHGNTAHFTYVPDQRACYRIFLGDRMHYKNGIKLGIEHGGTNDRNTFYHCVFYAYEAGGATLTQTDMLDVGDTTSESQHSYTISGQQAIETGNYYYEGDDDTISISDNGRIHNNYSQFQVSISPTNGGVILRRRMDYQRANQRAYVYVDGSLVGTWYDAGSNSSKRWRDSDFQIPASFTSGKSSITVKISSIGGVSWSEYRYWVFSVRDTSVMFGSLAGTVRDSGGIGLGGVVITANPGGYSTQTESNGTYTLQPLPVGTYTVTASKTGYYTETRTNVTISANQTTTLDINMTPIPPGTISGHVRDTMGNPLAGATVSASPGGYSTETNTGGRYSMNVPAGTYNVTATRTGFLPQTRTEQVVVSSQTTTVDFSLSPLVAIGTTKTLLDGAQVATGGIVTARFPVGGPQEAIYIEAPDRSAGIQVLTVTQVSLGDEITVSGTVGSLNGEKVIYNASVIPLRTGVPIPKALGMTQRSLGGGPFGDQAGVVDDASAGIWSTATNNIGLLVTISGRVAQADPGGVFLYLDDGSGIRDGSGFPGVRVEWSGLPKLQPGVNVVVTGVSSVFRVGGNVARRLRPRGMQDLLYASSINYLSNPGFETGNLSPWTVYGTVDGVITGSWYGGITAHSGNCFLGSAANWGTKSGGVYQRVQVPVGALLCGKAWSRVYWGDNSSSSVQNRVGIDPTGGTNPLSASVQWSPVDTQPVAWTSAWKELKTPSVICPTGYVTIFLDMKQSDSAGWYINCFDDTEITPP